MSDKKRRGWPFDDDEFFDQFEDVFEQMRRRMEKLMSGSLRDLEAEKPLVWGYTVRVGPDGKPQFRQFGDTNVTRPWEEESRREPLTDVLERDDTISITAELPGVEKEDVDLRVTPDRLVIQVDTEEREYYKDVDLPSPVDPDSVQATYRNGILDVTLKKVEREPGKRVPID